MLDAWLNTGMAAPFEMISATTSLTPVFNPPGSASGPEQSLMQVTGYDPGSGAITLSYAPACDAADHTIHYGSLDNLATYGWASAQCDFGTSGNLIFTPDPGVGQSLFWVIVGKNPTYEGSYGTDGAGQERPVSAVAGVCALPQSLAAVCE